MQTLSHKQRTLILTQLGVKHAKGLNAGRSKYLTKKPPEPTDPESRKPIPVYCTTTGETFPSINAAALAHGVHRSNLWAHLQGDVFEVGGKRYQYFTKQILRKPSARGCGVRCVETGETFTGTIEAAKAHGISQGGLSEHLSGKRKHVKGRTYQYV
jgi:hypothetical protein